MVLKFFAPFSFFTFVLNIIASSQDNLTKKMLNLTNCPQTTQDLCRILIPNPPPETQKFPTSEVMLNI